MASRKPKPQKAVEAEMPKSEYVEHMASYESKAEKKANAEKSSDKKNELINHTKFDKFKK